jgi:hypothetical protein
MLFFLKRQALSSDLHCQAGSLGLWLSGLLKFMKELMARLS